MKIQRFALIAVLLSGTAFAQTNTYPFPASGNVGIGTISPAAYKLNISNPAGYGILSTAGYSDTVGGRRNFTLNAGSGDWWASDPVKKGLRWRFHYRALTFWLSKASIHQVIGSSRRSGRWHLHFELSGNIDLVV